jgi:hypothetical protein
MNYIILGKSIKKGISNDDSSSLSVYFELGWEVVGSRIDFIKLVKTRNIDSNNYTAVTSSDRVFFYSKIFDNVISYDDFSKINVTSEDTVDDWTISKTPGGSNYFSFLDEKSFVGEDRKYIRYDEDYNEIFNGFDLSKVSIQKPEKYAVLGLRKRDHSSNKNFQPSFFENLVEKINKNLTTNVYVVGYGTEEFCKNTGCTYVEKLIDFVYLIKDKNRCVSYVTQSTGTAVLSLSSSEVPIHLLDHTGCSDLMGNNAVLGGKCIQFCKDEIFLYRTLNDEIIGKIINECKCKL